LENESEGVENESERGVKMKVTGRRGGLENECERGVKNENDREGSRMKVNREWRMKDEWRMKVTGSLRE